VYFLLLGRFEQSSSENDPEAGMHYSPENPRIPDDQTARAHRSIFVDGSTSKSARPNGYIVRSACRWYGTTMRRSLGSCLLGQGKWHIGPRAEADAQFSGPNAILGWNFLAPIFVC